MKFQLIDSSVLSTACDLAVIPVHGDPSKDALFKAADAALDGAASDQANHQSFAGKKGQALLVHTRGAVPARYVAFVGAGARQGFAVSTVRDLAARALKLGKSTQAETVAFALPAGATGARATRAVEFAVSGAVLGDYSFAKYRTKGANGANKDPHQVGRFVVDALRLAPGKKKAATAAQKRGLKAAIQRGEILGEAICNARDLVNEPADVITPAGLAAHARKLAKASGLKVKILNAADCEKLGMGMFLAVGRGSAEQSQLIHLSYVPKRKAKKRVALIGKGVTFDSGGYSLKPSASMEDMKIDMSGAAAVVSAMGAIGKLGSDYEVHGICACAENLVSGNAYKLGDVLHAMDGTTVEINNTDAEGRLTLGDAIAYARAKVEPDEMFDFATLTGACMVALGPHTAAVMSDSEDVAKRWLKAADDAGEDVWRLPLTPRLKDQLKSNIADMRNTGERWGGAITAGLFLKHFAKDTPWVHVDIAGPASTNRATSAVPKGGTGFAVASMVEYLTR